jgi:hypothetical protein
MSDFQNPFADLPPSTVNVDDITKTEVDPHRRAQLDTLGKKDAGFFNHIWAALWASFTDGLSYLAAQFADALDEVLAGVGKFFLIGQGEKNSSFYDLAGTILEDLTGVPVDKAALKNSAFGSGRLAAMQTFGGDLFKLLVEEFKPTAGDLEAGDVAPAERFLGFLMNFSIRQGNIELLCSMLPESVRIGEGFRAYGENMAKNLGLSRLARRALQGMIQILVNDPLVMSLNEQYRPKRLPKEKAITKFFRDPSFLDQAKKEMAQEGFSDARIQDLIDDARPLLAERLLIEHAFRFGDNPVTIGQSTSLNLHDSLSQRGYSDVDIKKLIDLARPTLKENEIGLLFLNNVIDKQTALDWFSKLGYDTDTGALALQAHAISHTHAHHIGLGELRKAFHNNVIDLLELRSHLSAQGYSEDDIQIITLDLLQPATGKVRQLSLAEIRAGYKAGALTIEQATSHLKTLGYTDSDVQVILKIVTAAPTPKPPAAPAAPAA